MQVLMLQRPRTGRLQVLCGNVLLLVLAGFGSHAVSAQTPSRMAPPLARALRALPAGAAASDARRLPCRVQTHDAAQLQAWLARHAPAAVLRPVLGQPALYDLHDLPRHLLPQLAALPAVRYVDRTARPEPELAGEFIDIRSNGVDAVHRLFPTLDGRGRNLSVKDAGLDSGDIDFRGRILPSDGLTADIATHSAIMATIAAGAGNSAPEGRGCAPAAGIGSSSYARLLPDPDPSLTPYGVQNHSYGVGVESYYGLEAQAYDAQVAARPELLHVFSSGNRGGEAPPEGPYAGLIGWANLTGQFKQSKNTLSVGAVNRIGQRLGVSSAGPAHDGRIKPELVALGDGGTSEAAAVVAGTALLLQQAYAEREGQPPPAHLVKAALVSTTQDIGATGPDYATGYGNADALAAVRCITGGQYRTGTVAEAATWTHTLTVPPGARSLRVTLAWTDPPAEAGTDRALVQDLDLRLVPLAGGPAIQPWVLDARAEAARLAAPAARGRDSLNNLEQVWLAAPAGSYRVEVHGRRLPAGQQPFAIAWYAPAAPGWRYPVAGALMPAARPDFLRWSAEGLSGPARLEARWGGAGAWQLVTDTLRLEAQQLIWFPPDSAVLAELRLVHATGTWATGTFRIAPEPALRMGYVCTDGVLLQWPPMPNATAYQVYRLGERSLEPLATVSDTLLALPQPTPGTYFAVAAHYHWGEGLRSPTIDYRLDGTGCYQRSFLATPVGARVALALQLSTLYQVARVRLERQDGTRWVPLYDEPAQQLIVDVDDPAPQPGPNRYRAVVTTAAGNQVPGPVETVWFVAPERVFVYPNPVPRGHDLRVRTAGLNAQLDLYDIRGRLMGRLRSFGDEKTFPTAGLTPGVYVLRTRDDSGRHLPDQRVVVQ